MEKFGGRIRIGVACCVLLAAFALQGCREEEQGRILRYQKGTYLGKPDQQLTHAQKEALRLRTARQKSQ